MVVTGIAVLDSRMSWNESINKDYGCRAARDNVTQHTGPSKQVEAKPKGKRPFSTTIMDSFDNFQYDSASSYGGLGVVDDTSSVYTATTQDNAASEVDLSSLALSEYNGETSAGNGHAHHHHHEPQNQEGSTLDEDFYAVLDDLKDEAAVDLPPHACRCVIFFIH
jgi:hypothetical protein